MKATVIAVSSNANSFGYKGVLVLTSEGAGFELAVQAYGTDTVPAVGEDVDTEENRFYSPLTRALPPCQKSKVAGVIAAARKAGGFDKPAPRVAESARYGYAKPIRGLAGFEVHTVKVVDGSCEAIPEGEAIPDGVEVTHSIYSIGEDGLSEWRQDFPTFREADLCAREAFLTNQ
jgi:hypothetical protein